LSGKTTTALQAPNPILAACEVGYKAIPNTIAFDVHSWTDMLSFVSQLKKPEAKERFDTVVIDTLDELVFYAEEFVLSKHGVSTLSDIPWGAGYTELAQMFRRLFHSIIKDYGLIIVAHADLKIDPEDEDNRYATLGINKKVKKIVVGLLDILTYVESSRDPSIPNLLHFRAGQGWEAKCRFANIKPVVEFSYENLVNAIEEASSSYATAEHHKDYFHDEDDSISHEEIEALKAEITEMAKQKIEQMGDSQPILQLIDQTLAKKIAECTPQDYQGLNVLKEELDRI
jgi:hypothetical protein